MIRRDYVANGGWETFLSYEDPERDILVGLLRLRKCSKEGTYREELLKDGQSSMVRELHGQSLLLVSPLLPVRTDARRAVYGTAVPMHARDPTLFQHQGIGTLLMEEAERIAREEHGSKKLAVISGIGVRSYYARLGYELEGPYMTFVPTFSSFAPCTSADGFVGRIGNCSKMRIGVDCSFLGCNRIVSSSSLVSSSHVTQRIEERQKQNQYNQTERQDYRQENSCTARSNESEA